MLFNISSMLRMKSTNGLLISNRIIWHLKTNPLWPKKWQNRIARIDACVCMKRNIFRRREKNRIHWNARGSLRSESWESTTPDSFRLWFSERVGGWPGIIRLDYNNNVLRFYVQSRISYAKRGELKTLEIPFAEKFGKLPSSAHVHDLCFWKKKKKVDRTRSSWSSTRDVPSTPTSSSSSGNITSRGGRGVEH